MNESQSSAELSRLRDDAEAASRAKSAFLANMSHEIRTPLNAILGMAELLETSELTASQRRHVRVLRNAGQALIDLVGEVLDLAKVEAGKLELAVAPFSLQGLLESVVEFVAVSAHRKGLYLTLDVDPALSGRLVGDEHRLRQVLLNLLGNAVKFTERGGISVCTVLETTIEDRARVRVSIADTGIGIPADGGDSLFQPFTQVDATTARVHGGTGLGLSLCDRLLQLMGGRIWFESRIGIGSTFHFAVELPLSTPGGCAPSDGADVTIGRGRRALVADDLPAERQALRRHLERWGFDVSEAEGGGAAIATITQAVREAKPFDLLLLDASMPTVGGLDVVESTLGLASVARRSVLTVTADHREDELRRAAELSLAETLVKPVRPSALLAVIRRLSGMPAPAAEPVDVETATEEGGNWEGTILVADDSEDNRLVVSEFLAGTGLRIECAPNGEAAVAKAATGRFDFILMDLHMPVMDGFAAVRAIRGLEEVARRPRVPILAFTADALAEDRERSLAIGCDGHLSKPVSRRSLFAALGHHFRPAAEKPDRELEDLKADYVRRRHDDVVTLRDALAAGELATIGRLGHNMKGSGSSYGFPEITRIGSRIESAAKAGDRSRLAREVEELGRCLESLRILIPSESSR